MMDLTANRKRLLAVFGALFLVALAAVGLLHLPLEMPYRQGTILTYSYQGDLESRTFQDAVETVLGEKVILQSKTDLPSGSTQYEVTLVGGEPLTQGQQMELTATLAVTFPQNDVSLSSSLVLERAVGQRFWVKCLIASAVITAFILVFFTARFPLVGGWLAGLLAVAINLYNLVVVAGSCALFRIPVGEQFFPVALVMLFFSLHGQVSLLDRIRENRRLCGKTVSRPQLLDRSVAQYLRRLFPILVAAALALAVLSVGALLGRVDSILNFSFPLLWGILVSSFTSAFLFGPLWAWGGERRDHKKPVQ